MEIRYMTQLDGVRAIALGMIMFEHYTIGVPMFYKFDTLLGASGVNMFFVLSGFLITLILLNNRDLNSSHILKRFYIRRMLRIFPLYYFIIGVGLVFAIPPARQDVWWLLTYLTNWLTTIRNGNVAYYSHLWSLSVEEQFYIFFPALLLAVPKKYTKNLFIILIAVGILSRVVIVILNKNVEWAAHSFTTCCLDGFGLGALLSYLFNYKKEQLRLFITKYTTFFWLSLVIAIVMFYGFNSIYLVDFRIVLYRFLFSVFCFWLVAKGAFSQIKWLGGKAITFIGRISYGLYVYHYFMLYFLANLPIHSPHLVVATLIKTVIYSIVSVIIATLSFYCFEKPITSLKKHFLY